MERGKGVAAGTPEKEQAGVDSDWPVGRRGGGGGRDDLSAGGPHHRGRAGYGRGGVGQFRRR